jgi:hypothetical protein
MDKEQTVPKDIRLIDEKMVVVVIVLAAILACSAFYYVYTETRSRTLMDGAIYGLRGIGTAELVYQSGNNQKNFGSFRSLEETGMISPGETMENVIPGYYLTWDSPGNHFFTIVAYPYHPQNLKTFAMTEDMVIRVFNPRKNNDPHAPASWKVEQDLSKLLNGKFAHRGIISKDKSGIGSNNPAR